jgi:hypothetical protein
MRIKSVNRPDNLKGFMRGVQRGAQIFGGIKTAIDIGRTVVSAARTAAPYVATIASVL